jgi:hypothetical protein
MTPMPGGAFPAGRGGRASPLLQAALDEFLSLRTNDPLIDRLLEAVDVGLRHAQLHLIPSVLPLDCL